MKAFLLALFLVASVSAFIVPPYNHDLIVNTNQGRVQGRFDPETGGQALSFKGIPYAAPPGRFQAPVPPAHRGDSIYQADQFGSPCLQKTANTSGASSSSELMIGSEDCLYLNIWVPGNRRSYNYRTTNNDRLPVVIAFHDGRQATGSGGDSSIIGNLFAAHHEQAIWVSFNYRLGVWGFLSLAGLTNEQGFSGAYGALDQLEAIKWVKQNIHFFGGNPDRMMLYGVGGGATGVATMLASASTVGLFHAVHMESPYGTCQQSQANVEVMWGNLIDGNLNCSGYLNPVDCVRNVTNEDLCDAVSMPPPALPFTPHPNAPWDPALFWQNHHIVPAGGWLPDKITNILKNDPPNRDVTVLIGGSQSESSWYDVLYPSGSSFSNARMTYFVTQYLECQFPFESSNTTARDLVAAALIAAYGGNNLLLHGDGAYTCQIVAMLNCSEQGGSEEWYHFHINRTSPMNMWTAHHASGNPFWTHNLQVDKYGNERIPNGDDFCVRDILSYFLTNTARNADPNNSNMQNINQLQQWPKWDRDTQHHLNIMHCPTSKNNVPFAAYQRCMNLWFNPYSLIV